MSKLNLSLKIVNTSSPCVCCKVVPHDSIPDRDLDGYVCKDCSGWLKIAVKLLASVGIEGCSRNQIRGGA